MEIAQLPFVDEHRKVIAAGVDDVWPVLLETLDATFSYAGAAPYARIVGCDDRAVSGPRPLAKGSTMPGFRVTTAVPGTELVLEGHHRFSSYALIFHLEPISPDQSRLCAETRAAFPGWAGRAYRLIVIGTGGHVVAVRRLLSRVVHQIETRRKISDLRP